ncbi:hypothetical protein D3C71_2064790 [compost metagenome]
MHDLYAGFDGVQALVHVGDVGRPSRDLDGQPAHADLRRHDGFAKGLGNEHGVEGFIAGLEACLVQRAQAGERAVARVLFVHHGVDADQ